MFERQDVRIIDDLYLHAPIHESTDWDLDFFDREGYQLNSIEKEYHHENRIGLHTEDRMARRVSDNALNAAIILTVTLGSSVRIFSILVQNFS